MTWRDFLSEHLLDNSLQAWLVALFGFVIIFALLPRVRRYVEARRRTWDPAHVPKGIEIAAMLVGATSPLVLLAAAFYVTVKVLSLPPRLHTICETIIVVSLWLQVGLWLLALLRFALDRHHQKNSADNVGRAGSFEVLMFAAKLIIFSLVLLLALENLGINITTLLTGLGIGGVAVALAVQGVLGDLLASLSITLDKPFEVGDALALADERGTVERIGIKSTRLRSVNGEQIIIPNADMLKSRVRNFKRMNERRYVFSLGVRYETPIERLREIPQIIEAAVLSQDKTRFDRCHLMSFGEYALTFETAFFVTVPDYKVFTDIQHAINLAIVEEFDEREIDFAYPTQRVIAAEPRAPS